MAGARRLLSTIVKDSPPMKIFIPGATGYIGGSVAVRLASEGHQIVGLARTAEKAEALRQLGIEPLIGSLEDPEVIALGARSADAVISVADSDRLDLAEMLVDALTGSGKTLIHTSGASIVVDDAKGSFASDEIFADDTPYVPMDHRLQRIAVDTFVRTAGITKGIRAIVICPTMVYGPGRGIAAESDQLPKLFAQSRAQSAGVHIGEGVNIWSHVHIDDLTGLYSILLEKAPSGSFFFAQSGESSMKEIAVIVSKTLGFDGRIETWPFDKAVGELGPWPRIALATNCRVRAINARALGWSPGAPSLADTLLGAAE